MDREDQGKPTLATILRTMGGICEESPRRPGLRVDVRVTVSEAAAGATLEIAYPRDVPCTACAEVARLPCRACKGAGGSKVQHGFFQVEVACPICHGHKTVTVKPCKACEGRGTVARHSALLVTVPAGAKDGDTIPVDDELEARVRIGDVAEPALPRARVRGGRGAFPWALAVGVVVVALVMIAARLL